MKYSIIIPTAFAYLDKYLKTCLQSIIEYSTLDNLEVIVVSNGSTDATDEYVRNLGEPFKLISVPEAIGYAKACNMGFAAATGDYIILLNNDTKLLDQKKDCWLEMLEEPFKHDPTVGITGPIKTYNLEAGERFLIFFCVMIKREVVEKLKFSEDYGFGTFEDIEYCIEAEKLGYKMVQVPERMITKEPNRFVGTFPIWHFGGATISSDNLPKNSKVWEKNGLTFGKKYDTRWYHQRLKDMEREKTPKRILAFVPTRDRYDSLALTLQAIAFQTIRPNKVLIFDDGEHKDLREDTIYKHIFMLFNERNIAWSVAFGDGKGQHFGHQIANTEGYEFVWRVDDDEVPEVDTLERLLAHMTPEVGAVGGAVYEPDTRQINGSNYIEDIFHKNNLQWAVDYGTYDDIDHLYSSFLYRSGIVNYNLNLSPVAHREETLFTYALKRAGYKLIADTSIKTYHYRHSKGGIRSNNHKAFFDHDNKIFLNYLEECGIKVISLDTGLGDHFAFLNIVRELEAKYDTILLGCCYPQVFWGCSKVKTLPLSATQDVTDDHVYKYCIDHNWKGSIVDAYRKMFL